MKHVVVAQQQQEQQQLDACDKNHVDACDKNNVENKNNINHNISIGEKIEKHKKNENLKIKYELRSLQFDSRLHYPTFENFFDVISIDESVFGFDETKNCSNNSNNYNNNNNSNNNNINHYDDILNSVNSVNNAHKNNSNETNDSNSTCSNDSNKTIKKLIKTKNNENFIFLNDAVVEEENFKKLKKFEADFENFPLNGFNYYYLICFC
jgi:hypothetical protein